jgi:Mycothiol maleylpyruvate isomerase N-terminal domain
MATPSPWPLIHAEREALAEDLSSLVGAQWQTPSLCAGWSVRDVFGHMTATARMTPARFLTGLAGAGFRFNAMSARDVSRETARIAGVELRASDAQWSTGTGPEVSGPALSLVLAMTGRAAALDDLSGDGLETLRSRF